MLLLLLYLYVVLCYWPLCVSALLAPGSVAWLRVMFVCSLAGGGGAP